MMTLNIHDVSAIDLGDVRSYFSNDTKRLFYAREILITSSTGSFRLSLYADQSNDLDLESSASLNRLNVTTTHEGEMICLTS